MARKGRTSIVREVKESIDAIDKIGQSKRDAKRNSTHGIHSIKQKRNTMSDAQNFVKWVRTEHGVKSIADLSQEHYAAYIAYMADKGLSKGHMQNVETSLRLLEKGFKERLKRSEGLTERFKGFCPTKRLVHVKTGESVRNRAYNAREVQAIREQCSPEVQKAVDLMSSLGLRVREAANVRAEHFVAEGDSWYLKIAQGKGITKGGRFRYVPVPKTFEQRLVQLLVGKHPEERLVCVASGTIRDGVNMACKKANVLQAGRGCHGFRHAYARDRLAQLATKEQRDMMQRILSNREQGRKADYGILSEKERALYMGTKAVMDKIHSELGHGKNRWELAMRYLR
ncbi:site-specific integrase [Lysinibacillus sp. NPDC098008]|uniref:site-specific integrase n=1 Tax=Lysinibacillus sp. NPDC098008 TaxID=3364146 RepID=UPI00380988C3